jgi:hypothetical protein
MGRPPVVISWLEVVPLLEEPGRLWLCQLLCCRAIRTSTTNVQAVRVTLDDSGWVGCKHPKLPKYFSLVN